MNNIIGIDDLPGVPDQEGSLPSPDNGNEVSGGQIPTFENPPPPPPKK